MKKINIYLVTNEDEVEQDRKEIGNFIRDLNDKYEEYNVYFKLTTSNNEEINNKDIENSELFFIIFCKEIDKITIEKFNIAYDSFKNNKNPKISTYIKKTEGNPGETVISFMEKLDKEIGHYYNNYDSIDTIKLNLVLKLKTLGLNFGKIETKEGKLYMAQKEVMSLDNIPIIFNNKDLNRLKKEVSSIEEEYWKLKEWLRNNPNDEKVKENLNKIIEKGNQVKESIFELEKNIIDLQGSFIKSSSEGELSKRQIYAQNCLEQGDIEAAKEALNLDEIKDEANKILELQDAKKDALRVKVNELLQRVQTLMVDTHNKSRFEEIETTFEEAVRIEKDGGLYRSATLKYTEYLLNNNKCEKAISLSKMFIAYLEAEGIEDKIQDKCLAQSILGKSYSSLEQYEEAEKFFIQNIEMSTSLGDYEKIAEAYTEIAENIYEKTQDFGRQIEYYTKLIDIYKNHIKSEIKLYSSYISLAVSYRMINNYEKFEENLEKGIEINKKLREKESEESILGDAFAMYRTLAVSSETKDKYEKAYNCYMEAIKIGEKLTIDNPIKYGEESREVIMDFFTFCMIIKKKIFNKEARKICKILKNAEKQCTNKADNLVADIVVSITLLTKYMDNNDYEKINKEIGLALEKTKELELLIYSDENITTGASKKDEWNDACASIYHMAGNISFNNGENERAIEYYEKGVELVNKRKVKHNNNIIVLAMTYLNMGRAYEKLEDNNNAVENYKLSIEFFKRLLKDKADQNDQELLKVYGSLLNLYEKENKYNELLEFYSEAIELQEKIAKQNEKFYNRALAIYYNNLAFAHEKLQQYEEAEKNYQKSVEVNNNIINEENSKNVTKSLKNNYKNLCNLYKKMGKEDKANEYKAKAEKLKEGENSSE